MTFPKLFATAAASAMLCTTTALAQQDQQQTQDQQNQQQTQTQQNQQQTQQNQQQTQQNQGQQQVAQQCVDDLQALSQRMNEEGYWLTGWGGRWGARPGARPFPGTPAPGATETTDATGEAGAPDATTPNPGFGVQPWGWRAPSFQIRTLFTSAHVLALRGDQEGCNVVLSELTQLYDEYVEQLQQAGVEPGEVANWRQEMLVAARPVTEIDQATINFGDVTDTEIRNAEDEQLGTVDDVLLGPDGQILYVVVSRGGFLGIGEEHTLVPWQALQATPDFNMFLLDVPEQVMEQAPEVDPDAIGDPDAMAGQRQQIDQYWQQHTSG